VEKQTHIEGWNQQVDEPCGAGEHSRDVDHRILDRQTRDASSAQQRERKSRRATQEC